MASKQENGQLTVYSYYTQIIANSLYKRKQVYCAFTDFEKCFDKLNRTLFFEKLLKEQASTLFAKAALCMYFPVKAAYQLSLNQILGQYKEILLPVYFFYFSLMI